MDRQTDQQAYLPEEMQFYISVMFPGLPDDIHEEKPSFLQLKKWSSPTKSLEAKFHGTVNLQSKGFQGTSHFFPIEPKSLRAIS